MIGTRRSLLSPARQSVFAGASVALSLRIPALCNYNEPLIRVRRSIDNTEQDISALATVDAYGNRQLNSVALLAFASGSDCYVTKWYDQSANGLDASQSSAALQPKIVAAGVYLGMVDFSAAATANTGRLVFASALVLQAFPYTANVVLKNTGGTSVILGTVNATVQFLRISGTAAARFQPGSVFGSTFNATSPVVCTEIMRTNLAPSGWVNGGFVGEASSAAAQGLTTNGPGAWVGAASAFAASEITIFPFALSTVRRVALERSQGSAFGISVA